MWKRRWEKRKTRKEKTKTGKKSERGNRDKKEDERVV